VTTNTGVRINKPIKTLDVAGSKKWRSNAEKFFILFFYHTEKKETSK